ncbi:unnamed protein product [Linum tenue]|uniref:t-SNARE coiled-coil homology domain-containing protein n=1 Tax=Linum tenue TaxID=586396 RepID=A0AAV0LQA3_9ROSI|nr:unnamed protein product [Linum tenue]
MASSSDAWMKEYNEAAKLADDITGMISSLPSAGPESQRHASAARRKITILGTRLDSLQTLLTKLPGKQHVSEKEMNRRRDMIGNLRTKANQMASSLNMTSFANRDSLLGTEIKQSDIMSRTTEQDEGLEKLEETVISTKHIALAVNEELDLHTRLIDDLDEHVDVTDSRLRSAEAIGSIEQADQGRLHLPVHAYGRNWDRGSGCGHIYADQVLVIVPETPHFHYIGHCLALSACCSAHSATSRSPLLFLLYLPLLFGNSLLPLLYGGAMLMWQKL